MDAVLNFLHWGFDHIFYLIISFFVVLKWQELYQALLMQPLRGGNGVVQMDELAKYILMVFLGVMIYYEGKRSEEHTSELQSH